MYERKQDSQVFYVLPVESSLGSCPSFQLAIKERFHIPCGSTQQTLSVQPSRQGREPVTVVGGGMRKGATDTKEDPGRPRGVVTRICTGPRPAGTGPGPAKTVLKS